MRKPAVVSKRKKKKGSKKQKRHVLVMPGILNAVTELASSPEPKESLHDSIHSILRGGFEGLLEIQHRPDDLIHRLLDDQSVAEKNQAILADQGDPLPAFLFVLGAYSCGDCDSETFHQVYTELCQRFPHALLVKESQAVETFIREMEEKRARAAVKVPQFSPLRNFLRGRRIVIIEDRLSKDAWDIALSATLGNPGDRLQPAKLDQRLDGAPLPVGEDSSGC